MGLEPAILGMLNKLLNKPTGGVDWTITTPQVVRGETSDQAAGTTVDIYTFTGEAFLTYYSITIGAYDAVGITATLYIDGVAVDSVSYSGSTSSWTYKTIEVPTSIWYIQNELKITVEVTGSTTGSTSVSYQLAMSTF